MNTNKKAEKNPIFYNVVLEVPENVGDILAKARENLAIHQKEVSDRLKMRGRASISEYETGKAPISEHTLSLMAIALNLHPNMPDKMKFGEELVFETNPVPEEGYSAFILNALEQRGMTLEELADITDSAEGITLAELQRIVEEKANEKGKLSIPRAKQWVKIQLALETYASGVNISKLLREKRLAKGWNQPELASILKLTKQTISNYESGHSIPGDHIWALLMLALDFHPNYHLLKQDVSSDWADQLSL
ncbi:helix-turn-helix domain-containing protein [Psychrobacter sp. AOP31-A1-22]|uniref:helix-turn-helix domain-containing protein n=1 Tax=Psychrobacter sp. AOP31-A1-22 TaxID=3457696 RepID=UPI004036FED4